MDHEEKNKTNKHGWSQSEYWSKGLTTAHVSLMILILSQWWEKLNPLVKTWFCIPMDPGICSLSAASDVYQLHNVRLKIGVIPHNVHINVIKNIRPCCDPFTQSLWVYLTALGRPMGVRLFCGLGNAFRILMEDTFPRSLCFCTTCDGKNQNKKSVTLIIYNESKWCRNGSVIVTR